MNSSALLSTAAWLTVALIPLGCSASRSKQLHHESQLSPPTEIVTAADFDTVSLGPYLALDVTGRRDARQLDSKQNRIPSRPFPRETTVQGRTEGNLVDRTAFPLSQFLDPHSRGVTRPRFPWPAIRGRKMDAFFAEFRPAIPEWPTHIRLGDTAVANAQITAFEFDGVPFATGNCKRTTRAIGFESVVADGRMYPDSLRMEADTELVFGWLATIRIHEVVWFVRELGWVKREDRYQGRALWLFRFQSESGYELVNSANSTGAKPDLNPTNPSIAAAMDPVQLGSPDSSDSQIRKGLISRVAICFERSGRSIRMSGLAMEWDIRGAETPTPQ